MHQAAAVFLTALASVVFGSLSPELAARLAQAEPDELVPVHVVLKTQFDPGLLNSLVEARARPERRAKVARVLAEFAAAEQSGLVARLNAGCARNITPLWIVNAVYCEATPELVRDVAARPEVDYVGYDLVPAPGVPGSPGTRAGRSDEIPWGVQRINAPAVWALGYTGQDVVVGLISTGTDYNHPDLSDHLWTDPNYPHHGWDFENNDDDPMDEHGHGTMTAGFVAADGTSGSQCGVAPDAQLMVCRVRATADVIAESQCWQAMQFCVSPPLSPTHGADVICLPLGWLLSWNPQQATWRTVATNVNAAGLCQFSSPGSEGNVNPPHNLRCPGHVPPPWWNPENTGSGTLAGIVAVGATDASDVIASFSSRGPVTWQEVAPFNDYVYPPGLTKPELAAPGVEVKTTLLGGGYTIVSGTSWSTALAAGAAAVLLSFDPSMSPAQVDEVLELSAVDLGSPGKDCVYGAGRIDLLRAVTGIGDHSAPALGSQRLEVWPSPFRTACQVSGVGPVLVLDAFGRRIASLSSGRWKPETGIRPGVYFLKGPGGQAVRVSCVR